MRFRLVHEQSEARPFDYTFSRLQTAEENRGRFFRQEYFRGKFRGNFT